MSMLIESCPLTTLIPVTGFPVAYAVYYKQCCLAVAGSGTFLYPAVLPGIFPDDYRYRGWAPPASRIRVCGHTQQVQG
jgi:hypothetical protein